MSRHMTPTISSRYTPLGVLIELGQPTERSSRSVEDK
jgi:hypothetical protein